MQFCKDMATLVQHISDADGDRYRCFLLSGVSWYAKTEVIRQEKGIKTGNVLKCRIPDKLLPDCIHPKTGDYMVYGALEIVGKTADLKEHSYFKITAVGDNRRGRNPHWQVSGV